jgi:hypothetical protein
MQRRTRARIIIVIALGTLAVIIARLTQPSAVGLIGVRALQQTLAAAAIAVVSWMDAASRTLHDPGRLVALEDELAGLGSAHAALQRAYLELVDDDAERARTYPERFGVPIVGRVAAARFEPTSQVLVIAHPRTDRLRSGDPALSRGALIGVVAAHGQTQTTVQLLTDPQSRVGVEEAATAGTLGVLETDSGGGLIITRIPTDRTVTVGNAVVTGAITAGIPRGLPVGTIAAVRTDPDGFFQTAALDPISDPRRALTVTVLTQSAE